MLLKARFHLENSQRWDLRSGSAWNDTETHRDGYSRNPAIRIRASGICTASFTITTEAYETTARILYFISRLTAADLWWSEVAPLDSLSSVSYRLVLVVADHDFLAFTWESPITFLGLRKRHNLSDKLRRIIKCEFPSCCFNNSV